MWLEIELDVRIACGNDVENLFCFVTIVFWPIVSITNLNSLLNNLRTTVITYKSPLSMVGLPITEERFTLKNNNLEARHGCR